jgi:hypothetical protein
MKSDTQLVRINPETSLELTVVIGDEQDGGTTVLWEGSMIDVPSDTGMLPVAALGKNALYQTLHCTTNVKDINPESNRTSVTYKFSSAGGSLRYAQEVPQANGWAQYSIAFVFLPRL